MTAITSLDRYRRLPSEEQMMRAIADLVALKNGRWFHVRDARTSPELADMWDLGIVISGFAALVEVKSQTRIVTPGQHQVADLLGTVERFWGGVVRPIPKSDAEMSYDEFLAMLEAS